MGQESVYFTQPAGVKKDFEAVRLVTVSKRSRGIMVICDHWSYVTMEVVSDELGIWLEKWQRGWQAFFL